MATIPIEVIVQDGPSPEPTPTPSDSGETNIVVPDTGAGTINNASNGGGIGSAVNIILPAIILVLSIGAIVALLIRRQQRRKNNINTDISKKEKLAATVSGTIAILAATVLVGNLVIPATNAATSVEPGTAELETEDKITIIATREQDSDTITATVKDTSYATANLDFGYKVTASMAEGLTNANLYLDGDETSEYYIAPVEDGTLTDNTWGYRLSEEDEDYLTVPLVNIPATIAKGNDNTIEDKPVDIYYTVQIDKDMPAGIYTGELEYTLTDNNFPAALTTMQGMTTEICENTYTPGNQVTDPVPTATLEDIRDHKTYTIAKLADGKCWMTQNLDLDLSTEVTLTPADTDVTENWTPMRSTISFTGTTVEGWQNDHNTPYSADPGDVYYYTSGTDADDIKYDSLEECEAEHSDGTCQHYHAGNYYNWSAAVANNDTSEMTEPYSNAPDSICPVGWRLPKGPDVVDWPRGNEMDVLISSYADVVGDIDVLAGGTVALREYSENGFNAVRVNPLWLVRSGEIVRLGSLEGNGADGPYITSTLDRQGSGGALTTIFREVVNLNGSDRSGGALIRCVAE